MLWPVYDNSIFGDHVKEVGTKGEMYFSTTVNNSCFLEKE